MATDATYTRASGLSPAPVADVSALRIGPRTAGVLARRIPSRMLIMSDASGTPDQCAACFRRSRNR